MLDTTVIQKRENAISGFDLYMIALHDSQCNIITRLNDKNRIAKDDFKSVAQFVTTNRVSKSVTYICLFLS